MYKIQNAGPKGLGIFASTRIPSGTRIIAESPLITVESERKAYAKIKTLPDRDVEWIHQLSRSSNRQPSVLDHIDASWNLARSAALPTPSAVTQYSALLAIFRNNNFDIGDGIQAMFREISRLNHACVPNSQGNFNHAIGKFTVHATREIEREEEITISYLTESGAMRESRQRTLWDGYGFQCVCPVCDGGTTTGQRSEGRRARILQSLREYSDRAAEGNDAGESDILHGLIGMFEDEGLAGRELSTMYLSAAERHANVGQHREASRYADLGLRLEQVSVGTDNPLYHDSVRRMKHITTTEK